MFRNSYEKDQYLTKHHHTKASITNGFGSTKDQTMGSDRNYRISGEISFPKKSENSPSKSRNADQMHNATSSSFRKCKNTNRYYRIEKSPSKIRDKEFKQNFSQRSYLNRIVKNEAGTVFLNSNI